MILRPRPAAPIRTSPASRSAIANCRRTRRRPRPAAARCLPPLPENIRRMALFADTRMSDLGIQGELRDPELQPAEQSHRSWPLNQIAKSIAADKPDVILNPGDCATARPTAPPGSSPGRQRPAAAVRRSPRAPTLHRQVPPGGGRRLHADGALFPVAPIAMLRGNREACFRAGNGFFFLDLCARNFRHVRADDRRRQTSRSR